MTRKLAKHPNSNCKIMEHDNGNIDFISYQTRVITIKKENGKRLIECTGTYTPTTAKQITYFCREYLPELNLAKMKEIAGKGFIAF